MKRLVSLAVLFTITFSISLTAQTTRKAAPAQQPAEEAKREVLTNESIISLVRAQFKEKTILALLRTSPVAFDLSAPKLIHLKRNGVNETVIQAMIQRQAIASDTFSLRDEEFFKADDDEFFNSPQRLPLPDFKRPTDKGKDSGAETDIFGSRSGGQSQTRSRGGMSGDRSGSSEVAGSATMRIIKPPTEGSEPKLERAPRLSNQQVVDMVQAGFSEGTILRRIEMEQVEFDLSPKAIEELRKNRVSDKVVKAMRTAMDESK
ncbi:MAG TPA: hypothetical protein VFZ34_23640 [Blastocatellia bacterium]|nr:hypothetical protein [Blastocatellia bacterium]